jgi:sugar/nucleoside kinase (ribokinase family)
MAAHHAQHPLDVAAVGNAIVDVLAHADESFLDELGMVKGTMALVDEDVARSIYDRMGPAVEVSGGSAANTAAGLAALGSAAEFVGKVAADQLGEVFAHDIRAAGVGFSVPPADRSDPPTGRCLVVVTPDAQRTLNTFLGMSSQLGPNDVDPAVIASAKVVYCEGYLWDQPGAKAAIELAMEAAISGGGEVAFTLSDPFCVDRNRAEFL